ncbi:hypothetical protein GJ689_21910 [Rhodoplanes serenus]|uniref:GlsB/YeaQ/YmgE family stress response membrane protein n=1 Tax=Rhodoplanes serenus TaxID=200615 RepID=A0A9X5ATQ0_9BRAD|nr:GlsB/YeaQ/YmgE family stress response membrane protein [Rhodoplanes serenus]MTW18857.1 hypothetical protein [Rhodoplanes serenus]
MSISMLFIIVVVGAAAGWIADRFATGKGFGLSGDAIVGIVGAIAGVLAARRFGVALMPGIGGTVIHAAAGAIVLLAIARVSQSGFGRGASAGKPVPTPSTKPAAAKPAAAKPAFRSALRQAAAAAPVPAVRPERPEPRQGR